MNKRRGGERERRGRYLNDSIDDALIKAVGGGDDDVEGGVVDAKGA